MNKLDTLSLTNSNTFIINLLQKDEPFFISRVGIGPETYVPYYYKLNSN